MSVRLYLQVAYKSPGNKTFEQKQGNDSAYSPNI